MAVWASRPMPLPRPPFFLKRPQSPSEHQGTRARSAARLAPDFDIARLMPNPMQQRFSIATADGFRRRGLGEFGLAPSQKKDALPINLPRFVIEIG